MKLQTNIISDKNILYMIAANLLESVRLLYDKYAAAMFGTVCSLTNDRKLVEEIFLEALAIKRKTNSC